MAQCPHVQSPCGEQVEEKTGNDLEEKYRQRQNERFVNSEFVIEEEVCFKNLSINNKRY